MVNLCLYFLFVHQRVKMFIKLFTLILLINASCNSYGLNLVNNSSFLLLNNTTFGNENFILDEISKITLYDEIKISDNEKGTNMKKLNNQKN